MSEERAMDCQDRHDDLAAYSLGALPAAEARALEEHLAGCEACSERLRWLRPAVDLMPASVPQLEAPEGLKQRLMDVVNEEASASAAPAPAPAPATKRRWMPSLVPFRPALAGLAALALLVAGVGGYALRGSDDEPAITYEANALDKGSNAHGLVSLSGHTATLHVEDLPPTSRGSVYQVWIGHENGQVTPSSTFVLSKDGTGEAAIPDVPATAVQIMVTREPAGGSKTPRGPQVLAADLT